MVLLVLAVIWIAVLIVPLVRGRAQGGLGNSIGTFRRHLSVLERTAPTTVSPANRLRTPASQAGIPPYRPPSSSLLPRPAVGVRRAPSAYPYAASPAALRRRQAQKRRRDVLFALIAGMAGSLLLGLIPGLSVMLWVHAGLDVLFAGYVCLLIRMRTLATEREMKLTFLPPVPTVYASYGQSQAAEARYSWAPAEYGDLLARRSAH